MTGCWAVVLAFPKPLDLPFDAAFVENAPMSWIVRDNSQPLRGVTNCWVIHASPQWLETHIEKTPEWVTDQLLNAFWQATVHTAIRPHIRKAHR